MSFFIILTSGKFLGLILAISGGLGLGYMVIVGDK